jgi:hypothetical protein
VTKLLGEAVKDQHPTIELLPVAATLISDRFRPRREAFVTRRDRSKKVITLS